MFVKVVIVIIILGVAIYIITWVWKKLNKLINPAAVPPPPPPPPPASDEPSED